METKTKMLDWDRMSRREKLCWRILIGATLLAAVIMFVSATLSEIH